MPQEENNIELPFSIYGEVWIQKTLLLAIRKKVAGSDSYEYDRATG